MNRQSGLDQGQDWLAKEQCRLNLGFEGEFLASCEHAYAMAANVATRSEWSPGCIDSAPIVRLCSMIPIPQVFTNSPSVFLDRRPLCRRSPVQLPHIQPRISVTPITPATLLSVDLFYNQANAHPTGASPGHSQIIDRSKRGEATNIPTGKGSRIDHITIRRERQASIEAGFRDPDHRAIMALKELPFEFRVGKIKLSSSLKESVPPLP